MMAYRHRAIFSFNFNHIHAAAFIACILGMYPCPCNYYYYHDYDRYHYDGLFHFSHGRKLPTTILFYKQKKSIPTST